MRLSILITKKNILFVPSIMSIRVKGLISFCEFTLLMVKRVPMNFKGSNILSIDQYERQDMVTIFSLAAFMECYAQRKKRTRVLEGALLGNIFFEPSTRTRVSFETAFYRLGGSVFNIADKTGTSMVKGESLEDTARVLGGYADVLVVRHPKEGSVKRCADVSSSPVINAGDGSGEHPTQALLDLYTIMKESGRSLDQIDGLSIAFVGDLKHSRTVHSLAKLLSLFKNIHFILISPNPLVMPQEIIQQLQSRGHTLEECRDLASGIGKADVIYMTRIQEERFSNPEESERYRGCYCLNKELYQKQVGSKMVPILHSLPRDSRPGALEIDQDLDDHPNLAIFRQANNGVPVRMALFALVLDVADIFSRT
jgi:aspartate carbamoyltransferase catalytic subunit